MVQSCVTYKTCSKCNKHLSLSSFYKYKEGPGGLYSWCKDCVKIKRQKHYLDNKEKVKNQVKRYGSTKKGSLIRRLAAYRKNAKSRQLQFLLDNNEVEALFNQECYYCGEDDYLHMGIDRKNNNVGYTKENCVACCSMCNFMKQDYTYLCFIEKCKNIARKHQNGS